MRPPTQGDPLALRVTAASLPAPSAGRCARWCSATASPRSSSAAGRVGRAMSFTRPLMRSLADERSASALVRRAFLGTVEVLPPDAQPTAWGAITVARIGLHRTHTMDSERRDATVRRDVDERSDGVHECSPVGGCDARRQIPAAARRSNMIRSRTGDTAGRAGSDRHGAQRRRRRPRTGLSPAASGGAAAVGVPATPTGYAELDQALGADKPFAGNTVTMQTQWITARATTSRPRWRPSRRRRDPVERRRGAVGPARATRERVPQRRRGSRHHHLGPAAHDQGLRRQGLIKDIATIMDAEKVTTEHATSIGCTRQATSIWGDPLQVRPQVGGLVPDQGLRGRGLQGPRRHGTSSSRCPTRSSRMAATLVHRHRVAGRHRLDHDRLGRGRDPADRRHRASTTSGPPSDPQFNSPEVKNAFDIVGKMFFTPGYVAGGGTAILATSFLDAMDPMFNGWHR